MESFRIFVQDVGKKGYSGLSDIEAYTVEHALDLVGAVSSKKYIALPHTRKDLWPNGKTGRVTEEALKLGGRQGN